MKNLSEEQIGAMLLDYAENSLNPQQRKEVELFLKNNPYYKEMVDNYDPNITITMPKIAYSHKERLSPSTIKNSLKIKRLTRRKNIFKYISFVTSAAAVILLIALFIKPQDNSIRAREIVKCVNISSPNDTIYIKDTVFIPQDISKKTKDNTNDDDFQSNVLSLFGFGFNTTIQGIRESAYKTNDTCAVIDFCDKDCMNYGDIMFKVSDNTIYGSITYNIDTVNRKEV